FTQSPAWLPFLHSKLVAVRFGGTYALMRRRVRVDVDCLPAPVDFPQTVFGVRIFGHDVPAVRDPVRRALAFCQVAQPFGRGSYCRQLIERQCRRVAEVIDGISKLTVSGAATGDDHVTECGCLQRFGLRVEVRQVALVEQCGYMREAAGLIPAPE